MGNDHESRNKNFIMCYDRKCSYGRKTSYRLMGDRADLRRSWIEDNVVFTLEDDYVKEVRS